MKSKILAGLLILGFLNSCEKEKTVDQVIDTKEVVMQTNSELPLQTFSALPQLADCHTYIAKSENEFNKQEFIFADDYGNNAYVQIEGREVVIPLEEGNFDPAATSRVIQWKDGVLHIDLQIIQQEDEDDEKSFEGTLKFQKGDKVYETPIFGKYSC